MTGQEAVLHHLELNASSDGRRSQPDRYDVDLLVVASWEHPYRVRLGWSGAGRDPGVLTWDFATMRGALRHIHVLLTRQQKLGYELTRIPRDHPYRTWLKAESADLEGTGGKTGAHRSHATLF